MEDVTKNDPAWRTRVLKPRLPWARREWRPADISEILCQMMLDPDNVIEDVNYSKIAPNQFVVELPEANFEQNYLPIAGRISEQWRVRLQEHLLTANSRQGRLEFRLAGSLDVKLRPAADLQPGQARVLFRLAPDASPSEMPAGPLACLESLSGGQRWSLFTGTLTLGRSSVCDICLDSPEIRARRLISSQHAYLVYAAGQFRLYDGSPDGRPSTNGTYVNGQRVPRTGCVLHPGDVIILAASPPGRASVDTPGVAALRFLEACL